MKYQWKVYSESRYVDSGTIEAENQGIAMGMVLIAQEEARKAGKRQDDKCYSITCGDSNTTSFGDEFLRSAEATSWTDESRSVDTGHNFKPKLSDVGIEPDPWDSANADPLKDIEEAKQKIYDQACQHDLKDPGCDQFISPHVFPKTDKCPGTIGGEHEWFMEDTGGGTQLLADSFKGLSKRGRDVLQDMLHAYDIAPQNVTSVEFSPMNRAWCVRAYCFDPVTGQQMEKQVMIDEYALIMA